VHILNVVGARPNFMKAAPVIRALARYNFVRQTLIHTGQHYDAAMSDVFFRHLDMSEPDVNLGVGSGSHAQQTATIMKRFEPVAESIKPDVVLVYGDVNSTVASALVCAKLLIPVAHVEAGLRSFDRTMPEEINRVVTDRLAEVLFTPSADGDDNLRAEGIPAARIYLVGNVMIDSVVRLLPAAEHSNILTELCLEPRKYGLVTLHRPSNVDDPKMLSDILETLHEISRELTLVFPVHPRTRNRLRHAVNGSGALLKLIEPLSYIEFMSLQRFARFVITDSGGIQEETTYLGIACLTVRENTERPITVSSGTNILVGSDMERLRLEVQRILQGNEKKGHIPPLWDGRAAQRIADVLVSWPGTAKRA
jgi:UDP-N-acetylglucosamine 2-epimerase (non-hydrolysing)